MNMVKSCLNEKMYITKLENGLDVIIVPIKNNGEEWKEVDLSKLYCSTEVVIAREVSNHYE